MTELNNQHALNRRIIKILIASENHNVLVCEKSIDVKYFRDHFAITLRGAMSRAERMYVRDQKSKAFLEILYTRQFAFLKQTLADDISLLLNRNCSGIELSLEPEPGDVILMLSLSDKVDVVSSRRKEVASVKGAAQATDVYESWKVAEKT